MEPNFKRSKMAKKRYAQIFILIVLLWSFCSVNILASRYYRLLEPERKLFLGLRSIDSVAAVEYLNLESATERSHFYEQFWGEKNEEERRQFEERTDYAFKQFGTVAPLSDDRVPVYITYGPPSKREIITPQKKIGIRVREVVKPAEIWTYKAQGIIFDFVRMGYAYKNIVQSTFGENVRIPHLKEITGDSIIDIESSAPLNFSVAIGRFRQKKNLTRLEIYISLDISDTTGLRIMRDVKIFNKNDSLIIGKKNCLVAQEGAHGIFYDEVNFWLAPEEYRLEISLVDTTHQRVGTQTLWVNLIDYLNDAKEISDIIPAVLIDEAISHEKFNKPVGRVIPLTQPIVPVYTPFYFYTEAYNLETKGGMHQVRTTYEVYNKIAMRQEIVDVMIKDWIEPGDIAYLATAYHPMDLPPGYYIMVVRVKDLVSGKERSAVTEFQLIGRD
jgi:GWxTD domain-containing protein